MHTIIQSKPYAGRVRSSGSEQVSFRQPNYDCREAASAVKLFVYVPGVEAAGVEIEVRGADLIITARKVHYVRVNWQALNLESAQRDYRLRLRLGSGFAYEAMHAEIGNGILTVTLPKRDAVPLRRVA